MWIKICGISTTEAALCCAKAGADAIGFVFAESSRKITVKAAAKIIEALPPTMQKIGVFVDAPWEDVAEIECRLGLDLLQFSGTESPSYCNRFPGKAVKSFRVKNSADLAAIKAYRDSIRACLLDSFEPGTAGGTGKTWNWSALGAEIKQKLFGIPLIVAGGRGRALYRSPCSHPDRRPPRSAARKPQLSPAGRRRAD